MKIIEDQKFDQERAFYAACDLLIRNCAFDGPADGESAVKESRNIQLEHVYCNLRYPFWHDHGLKITDSQLTPLCRAALWYSDHIEIEDTKMHGIKALRECSNVTIKNCDNVSPEFGWSVKNIQMEKTKAESEYYMMRSENLDFS